MPLSLPRTRACLSQLLPLQRPPSSRSEGPEQRVAPTLTDAVLIIDFGSQVTQLIARRVREAGVYSEIHPFQNAAEAFAKLKPKAVIMSGGPASVTEDGSPRAPDAVFSSGVPVLGICYGQQAMAEQLGGKVESGHDREFGRAFISIATPSPLFKGVWATALA